MKIVGLRNFVLTFKEKSILKNMHAYATEASNTGSPAI